MGIEKIVLPTDEARVLALKNKFVEYIKRMEVRKRENPYMHPDLFNQTYSHALYKMLILGRLLDKKEINTEEFSSEIKEKLGFLAEDGYSDAVGVISDYCLTGGKNTYDGTGLK